MKAIIVKNDQIRKELVIEAEKQGIETLVYLDVVESAYRCDFPQLKTIHEEICNVNP